MVQRCKLDAAEAAPFGCPDGCVFFEPRPLSDSTWETGGPEAE